MKRDREMLVFTERFKCITASIAAHIFFTGLKSGRIEASKRLNMLVDMGKLKKSQVGISSEVQYYFTKKQTRHQVKLLDYVAAQIELGYEHVTLLPEFKIPVKVMQTTHYLRVDGTVEMEKNGIKYRNYIEIDFYHGKKVQQYKDIAWGLYDIYYRKLMKGIDDKRIEKIVGVKKYLLHDHKEQIMKIDMHTHINQIIIKFLKPNEDYIMNAYYLPWNTEKFFFPQAALLIEEAASIKKEKSIALKLKRKKEKELLNPVPIKAKRVVKKVVKKVNQPDIFDIMFRNGNK